MKVALCFFGQPRYMENPYTWLSHKYHIIDRYNADIFAHTWISGEEKTFEYSDWVKIKTGIENKNASELILKKYKFKKCIFEPPKQFSLDDFSKNIIKEKEKNFYINFPKCDFYYSINNENNMLSQIYSMSKSISLLDGEKYDWIILSRYDNYISDFPNLYLLDKNYLYLDNKLIYNFSDILIFGGQKQIESLNCFDKIPSFCDKITYFTPEEFKRVAFQNIFGQDLTKSKRYEYQPGYEKRISIGVGIVRSNSLDNLQS